jgi:DNA polymerase I
MPDKTLFLIDAHALCYRAFYAVRGLATSQGQATNAVFGFVNALRKILRDYKPDYVAVCFDSKATRRLEKFAEYKIQRPKMPDELYSQISLIREVVDAYALSSFIQEGYEADDLIATLARMASRKGINVVIVSDDKDMFQLVTEQIKVYTSRQERILGPKDVEAFMGIAPDQVVDYIALAGDKIDNIPGVKGIGEVSAKELIKEYGDLDSILKNADKISSLRARKALISGREIAVLSRDLAILEDDVPIQFEWEALSRKEPDQKRLFEIFSRLEFRKFAAEVMGQGTEAKATPAEKITSQKEAKGLLARIQKQRCFAFMLEGCAQEGDLFDKQGFVIAVDEDNAFTLPLKSHDWLQDVWQDEKVTKITHDIKSKIKILSQVGCEVKGPVFDVMLAAYVLMPGRSDYAVSALAWNYQKKMLGDQPAVERETVSVYALYDGLAKELQEKGLVSLFYEIEMPLAAVLARMETVGVALDLKVLERLSRDCHQRMDALKKNLIEMAGEEFNLNSPKQLGHILFEKLKLPVIKRTKTGFSTDEEVLTRLAEKHKFPEKILEYRQLAKLQSTYIDALPKLVSPATGRLHASFDQTGTETGRLSSNNPNLQNIPIRTELGRQIRKAFVASSPKHRIVSADYSQIELRILAHLADDENLKKAFAEDQDIHDFTAALIFDVKEKDVTREMRDTAKRVNFGIIYGMSAFGLAKDLGIPQPQAQDFIDRYFLRYPKVRAFMDEQIRRCEADGFVTTLLQRRRYIPEIHSQNMAIRQFAQRQAINTPVQGSAADLIKLAMIHVQQALEQEGLKAQMIITVHDELVFDTPEAEVKALTALLCREMEHAFTLRVPIRVSVKQGHNWLDTEKVN